MPSWYPVFSKNEIFSDLQAMLWVVMTQVLCFRPVVSGLSPPSRVADENMLHL
jgi:hypothetical protein